MTFRKVVPVFALSVAASFLNACASDQSTQSPLLAQLTQARATWDAAKATCATYHYNNEHQHFPFGGCSKDAIEITDDQPTRRRGYGGAVGACADAVEVEWEETSAAIGSHAGGAAALTVEQLFADCQRSLAADPAMYELKLVIGPMGVPSTCGTVPKNCADDCFTGFDLTDFACGSLPPSPPPSPPIDGGAHD